MASAQPINWSALAPDIASRLLGDPNKDLSSRTELRFGTNGSMSIDLEKGSFYSHEEKKGGGMLDLIQRERGCDAAGALAWLESEGLKDSEDRPDPVANLRRGGSASYVYRDAAGKPVYRVQRKETGDGKTFVQHAADGRDGWKMGRGCMDGVERLPYRLPELVDPANANRVIFIVEGEKDADRLAGLGLLATCNSGGAGKFGANLGRWFAGRSVVVIPDNDRAGRDHALDVIAKLAGVAEKLTLLPLDGVADKGDVSDWLDAGHDADELRSLAADALQRPVVDLDPDGASNDNRVPLLPIRDAADFDGMDVPPREWMLPGWEPRRTCVYLTGLGASGKSLLTQQRMTCAAAGVPFLGIEPAPGVALYITCEDDQDELHRRQAAINKMLGVRWADLRGKLFLVSLKGQLNKELATFDAEGRMSVTERWHSLKATIESIGAEHVALDNVAHLFSGNENIRNQVAAFVGLLDGLAEAINGVVLLLGHPNKAGQEYSGSTAWENQVRARIFLSHVEDDPDGRSLTNSKPNYGRRGEALEFRWHEWAFTRIEDLPPNLRDQLSDTIAASAENERFLLCLDKAVQEKRATSTARSASNYAPRLFSKMTTANGMGMAAFEKAMERLLHLGTIENGVKLFQRDNRAWVTGIGRAPTLAPTPHQPAHEPCTNPDGDREGNVHQPARTQPPILRISGAAPSGSPAPRSEPEPDFANGTPHLTNEWHDNPSLGRKRRDQILAPGETGDEPVPGWERA